MFTLIKAGIALVVGGAVAYVTFFVPLGEKTLYQHLAGISATPEAQELGDEVRKKIDDAAEQIKTGAVNASLEVAADPPEGAREAAAEAVSEDDRQELREVIRAAAQPTEEDRARLSELISQKAAD